MKTLATSALCAVSMCVPGGLADAAGTDHTVRTGFPARCIASVVTAGASGGLAGAVVGSAVPVLGTTLGGALGIVAGGLSGGAEFC